MLTGFCLCLGLYHTQLQNTQGNGRPAAEEIEMSVIVPTGVSGCYSNTKHYLSIHLQDQRENLKEANERDVYTSLKIVQVC